VCNLTKRALLQRAFAAKRARSRAFIYIREVSSLTGLRGAERAPLGPTAEFSSWQLKVYKLKVYKLKIYKLSRKRRRNYGPPRTPEELDKEAALFGRSGGEGVTLFP